MLSAAPVIVEYMSTGLVERMPTWVLAMTLLLASMMIFMAGVILDSVARGRNEVKRIHYLSIAPSTHTQEISAFGQPKDIETETRQAAAPAMKAIK